MTAWLVAITAVFVAVLVLNQHRATPTVDRIVKMAASTGVIAVALSVGATTSTYGRLVLVALVLSWLGDLFLTAQAERAFRAGVVAFAGAHVAYIGAFAVRGIDPLWFVLSAIALALVAGRMWRWLGPHLSEKQLQIVRTYVILITVMVAMAMGTVGAEPDTRLLLGSTLFFLSDLAVARNRFVAPAATNQMVGRSLYYAGQVLLALSV